MTLKPPPGEHVTITDATIVTISQNRPINDAIL